MICFEFDGIFDDAGIKKKILGDGMVSNNNTIFKFMLFHANCFILDSKSRIHSDN